MTLEKDELLNIEWSYKVGNTYHMTMVLISPFLPFVPPLHLPSANHPLPTTSLCIAPHCPSFQYSHLEALDLFHTADLRVIDKWKAPDSDYHLWLVERPHVRFDNHTNAPATMKDEQAIIALDAIQGVPKWGDWLAMWKLWDHITLDMIPRDMLHQKPIDLRHICLFYLGHM